MEVACVLIPEAAFADSVEAGELAEQLELPEGAAGGQLEHALKLDSVA